MERVLFKSTARNEYSFLSNFWPFTKYSEIAREKYNLHPLSLDYSSVDPSTIGKIFHSSEHYFQYKKYMIVDPFYAENFIYPSDTAYDAKIKSGKGEYIKWLNPKRGTGAEAKREFDRKLTEFKKCATVIMITALYIKFSEPNLQKALLSTTGLFIQEQGRMEKDFWAHTGQDALGKILRRLRRFIINTTINNSMDNLLDLINYIHKKHPEIFIGAS